MDAAKRGILSNVTNDILAAVQALLDPGLELLGIVDRLGRPGDEGLEPRDVAYANALAEGCRKAHGHAAIETNREADARDPRFFSRRDALLMRSAPPSLALDEGLSAARGEEDRSGAWEPWLIGLRAFARAAAFTKAFAAAAPLLQDELSGLAAHLASAGHVAKIEEYAGLAFRGRYRVILSPLCAKAPELNRVWLRDDGAVEIASVVKPREHRADGKPFAEQGLDARVWHELCHGIMDMTVDLYDHEQRTAPLDGSAGADCLNWLHGMREHLARAVTLRLIALDRGEDAAAEQAKSEDFTSVKLLPAFLERLKEYERSRKKFPTLADFYPLLRELFPKAPEDGELDAAHPQGPYYTEAQRAAALQRLELMLQRSRAPRLKRRQKALLARGE